MEVKDFMHRQIVTAGPKTLMLEIWKLIMREQVHSLPIVDRDKHVIGIIVKEDLLEKLFPDYVDIIPDFSAGEDVDEDFKEKLDKIKNWTAERVMQKNVVFTRPNTNAMRALSRMIVRKIRQLPVIDDDDKIVGLVSKGDIFDGLFKKNVKRLLKRKNSSER